MFGILSNSQIFIFAHLDSQRNLFVSEVYSWRFKKTTIVQWIDKILIDAIHASPHPAPIKTKDTSLMAYQNYLNQGYHLGPVGGTIETVEDDQIQRYTILQSFGRGYLITPMDDPDSGGDVEQSETTHSHPDDRFK